MDNRVGNGTDHDTVRVSAAVIQRQVQAKRHRGWPSGPSGNRAGSGGVIVADCPFSRPGQASITSRQVSCEGQKTFAVSSGDGIGSRKHGVAVSDDRHEV